MRNFPHNIRIEMFSPLLYESVRVLSRYYSVQNFFHNIRTEMFYVLYLYGSANCVPSGIASAQNISDKFHTYMVSPLHESVHALSGCLSV